MPQRSHIEVGGWAARHYDLMMDLLLMGRYQSFIERAIKRMDIRRGDAILDLGSGTGRNICVMLKVLGPTGRVVGVDISQEMLRQARRQCQAYPQVSFLNRRIEGPAPFLRGVRQSVHLFHPARLRGRRQEAGACQRPLDVLATALHNGVTVEELARLDLAYVPPVAPVWDPLLVAANVALKE